MPEMLSARAVTEKAQTTRAATMMRFMPSSPTAMGSAAARCERPIFGRPRGMIGQFRPDHPPLRAIMARPVRDWQDPRQPSRLNPLARLGYSSRLSLTIKFPNSSFNSICITSSSSADSSTRLRRSLIAARVSSSILASIVTRHIDGRRSAAGCHSLPRASGGLSSADAVAAQDAPVSGACGPLSRAAGNTGNAFVSALAIQDHPH